MNAAKAVVVNRRVREKGGPQGKDCYEQGNKYLIISFAQPYKTLVDKRGKECQNDIVTYKPAVALNVRDNCYNKLLDGWRFSKYNVV